MDYHYHHAAVDSRSILELILTALNDIVEFELAVILKLIDDRTLRVQQAMGPLYTDVLSTFQIDLRGRGDIARILERSDPYLFDEEEEHIDTYDEVLDLPAGHSCLVAPLHLRGETIGMLTLDHRACNMFSENVVRFIGTIAKLIAIIIAQSDSSQYLLSQQRALTEERNRLLANRSDVFRDVIGTSPAWEQVLESVRIVAGSDLPVLIHGETGTGKEQIARSIHRLSARSVSQFVALNCSVLTPGLAESELFGHEKGAFTSAVGQRKGRFELANGGTLFLDEVGDLPAEVQPKLLRALQEGSFERVGGERTVHSDVRVIAASHVDLKDAVGTGRFREDLYYRLSVFPVALPPLRERRDDVVLLAEHFLAELREQRHHDGLHLSSDAVDSLLAHSWPGNVRELQNVIRRAALVAGGGRIDPQHLALRAESGAGTPGDGASTRRAGARDARGHAPAAGERTGADPSSVSTLDDAIRRHIERALAAAGDRIYGAGGAAEILGVKPTTLQSRMKKLGMSRSR
ncbi:MAG: sigma 54-interacting transcriptional regulator [bacterium]